MTTKDLDILRVLHGAFSSVKQTRSRIPNTTSGFFREKMFQAMLRKPETSNLIACNEVYGE